ncbi:zinc ion binding protein [Arabidopsis lyrata subsp. lyrata]|uniref:Zinc ion binding protein n=1 Tax=Arabidopsis lyrata subsp. lyrata TaxID=81972 RepID=D7MAE0_ARALL|nr:zinc ion binding protein [Arabidopsis lyrata subsp. lyrata]
MGEDYELEEGEMNCSSDEAVVDLDVDLSYIDKKVQNVLGHLQKDFGEGALDRFGPKICDYGSFLPTYKRSVAVPSCQRSSLGNHAVQRISNSLPGKNVVQKFQSLPATSSELVRNRDPQNYQTSGSILAQAPGKVPINKGNARTPANDLPDHKPIRVRIKMGSEILSQSVTMVCKDLGLDGSPNSPPRTYTSLGKTSESPSRILREMTAISVPEDLLMSPLPDSLLLVKNKEKRYTLLDNQPVIKTGKEPSIQTQNKFSDALCCEKTPIGRRRKEADCFDATTWNETKKQKVFSTGQRARDNSACGLGGASFTTNSNLQEGCRKDAESDPRVANKIKFVGLHAVKEKKTCPTKLQQNSSKNRFGDKFLSKMPCKDATYVGHNSMDIKFDFPVATSSTSVDVDNWAQCESCETWRLLPYGLNIEQLPDKWLCSMQTWLPGMNHCGVSKEETINAIKSYHASEGHGPVTGVKLLSDVSNADKSYQPLTSGSLPNPIEKKSNVKDLSQGVSKNMKLPGETLKATQMSTDLGVSHDFLQDKIDQKAKWRAAGTGCQIKIKKKKEADKKESDGSKHIKTGDGTKLARGVKAEEIHWNQDPEWTPAERKTKRHDNDVYTLDVERDTKKRLLASKKKPDHKPQLTTASGSLCTKSHGNINNPMRKIRLMGNKQVKDGNNSKLFADGEEKEPSMEMAVTTKISVQESKAHQKNELFQADGDGSQEFWNADASCRYFSGGSGQISGVETSSSSKVLGSHKSGRMYVEEVKASPVESVSSSPARSSCPTNLAANDILQEAEKLRKRADSFKSSGFEYQYKETIFKAALRFLLGASVLEMSSTDSVEGGKMSHIEAYHSAAKLSESCAHQYETSQEMAAAALAYKCTEVACMRLVYGRSLGLSGEWNELQKMVQMTPQGESPSSSASDVDSLNHQGVVDKSAKTKRGLSHVAGNLLPVARSQLNFVPLLDFTESMNLAMEASAKSQNAFKAVTVTSEETKHGDCISAIKKVVDFSFHDVEALVKMIEIAMDALRSSRFGGPKC